MNVDRRLDLIEERLNRVLEPAAPYAPLVVVLARAKTTIPERPALAGDAIELTGGTAEIWKEDPDDGDKLKPSGEIVDVTSWHKQDVSANVFIQIAPREGGGWTVISADCE